MFSVLEYRHCDFSGGIIEVMLSPFPGPHLKELVASSSWLLEYSDLCPSNMLREAKQTHCKFCAAGVADSPKWLTKLPASIARYTLSKSSRSCKCAAVIPGVRTPPVSAVWRRGKLSLLKSDQSKRNHCFYSKRPHLDGVVKQSIPGTNFTPLSVVIEMTTQPINQQKFIM